MESRQQDVLRTCVEAYIQRATPIGSHLLVDAYRFPYSSATVRNDLALLEDQGYLEQPHTSAGRVPTEKAYHFYVDHCLDDGQASPKDTKTLAALIEQWEGDASLLLKAIAKHSAQSLGETVVVEFAPHEVYMTGLTNLFAQPEFSDQDEVIEMSAVIDAVDEAMESVRGKLTGAVTVLIGADNPFSSSCATVFTLLSSSMAPQGMLAVLGPLRMDYRRVVGTVHWLHRHLSSQLL